ncbi:MAG TPA: DNA repair protein RecN [Candidatus Izemoplasmatales bacterium]|nr:DNA repair protein RecN [Candidatus Izemoplasmatales bacterium]
MLVSLCLNDFAIIDRIELKFRPGMTVLTGETGAGKSLLIDALSLLMGERASTDVIRSQAEKASVTGVFHYENRGLDSLLAKMQIDAPNQILEIRREVALGNKSQIKVNGIAVTLQQLRDISRYLADVHSQFDSQRLINPVHYLELIDGFKPDLVALHLARYREVRDRYRKIRGEVLRWRSQRTGLTEKNEWLRFQWNELEKASLRPGESEELTTQIAWMANFDKIHDRLLELRSRMTEQGTLEAVYDIAKGFERLGELVPEFLPQAERILGFYYEMDDMSATVQKQLKTLDFDPETLEKARERLDELEKLAHKYRKTIPELQEYQKELATLLDRTDHFDEYLKEAEDRLTVVFAECRDAAKELSRIRREIADRVENELLTVFRDLALPGTKLKIALSAKEPVDFLDEEAFGEDGADFAEFWLSTNVGEPLKPLAKTASGGEMSRIMLAFKTIFIRSQNLSTIVFDEIDTGISGTVARQIGRKIREISASCQVIAISHIPQVVAMASDHWKIWKRESGGRTTAEVKELNWEERITEIAGMISGDRVTESAVQNARELLLGE